MRPGETIETEKQRCTVDVSALRPAPDGRLQELRGALSGELAALVSEIPGAAADLEFFTDGDGMVAVQLAVSGPNRSALATEMAAVLSPLAETDVHNRPSPPRREWPIIADGHPHAIGFSVDDSIAATTLPWSPASKSIRPQLIEELAVVPGHGLRVRLTAHVDAPDRWAVQLTALTDGESPSLRLRALVRRRFHGVRIGADPSVPAVTLVVATEDLHEVFAPPVAGSEPVAGARQGAPALIAATPARNPMSAFTSGVRLGGAVTAGGRDVAVDLGVAERLRHVHVLGQTGTGKSSTLAAIAYGLARRGEGGLIVDSHGELCSRVLAELPESARDRVWLIRCGDIENPVPVNPLAEADPVRRDIAIADIGAMFQILFDKKETGIVGPRFIERVAMTLRALCAAHGDRASLLDVPLATADEQFMGRAVAKSGNDRLKAWWKTSQLEKQSNEHGQVLAWVNSKFESLAGTTAMRAVLGSGANAVDFGEAMDTGKIILLDLSKAELGESASRLLGFLYLDRVWRAALQRSRRDAPFTVMVDEAHTLIAGALTDMLAEGRKFGLSVVLAHQYLAQLDDDLRPAVDGNVATTIAFRSAVADVAELHRRFGGLIDSSTLLSQRDLTAVLTRNAATEPTRPHSLVVDHNRRIDARTGQALRSHVDAVVAATRSALVDPYRAATTAAAQGASNVTLLASPEDARSRPRPKPRPQAPTQPESAASFLDDWLAARTTSGSRSARAGTAAADEVSGGGYESDDQMRFDEVGETA